MPNLAKSPFSTSTLHLPQVWRPPQIDSISTPKDGQSSNSVAADFALAALGLEDDAKHVLFIA
ncbi:MAG: hypothetical protein R2911_26160 [Caldilineaceae bacterium]